MTFIILDQSAKHAWVSRELLVNLLSWDKVLMPLANFFMVNTHNGLELRSDRPSGKLSAQAIWEVCPNIRRVTEITLNWQCCTQKGRTNPCKDVFVLTSLCGATDPEWRAIKHPDAPAGHVKAQSVLALVPKSSSNDYETKTDEIHHVFSKAMKVLLSSASVLLHQPQQN